MTIIRNGKTYTLTAEELEKAYREQQHNYQLEDAECQFNDYLNLNYDDVEDFASCFGFTADEVCDPDSKHYLLEDFAASYAKNHDCDQAENDIWQEVIRNVLTDKAVNFKFTYAACYDLWETNYPDSWRKITSLLPVIYDSVEELNAAAPDFLANAFAQHGVFNGKVTVRTTIKEVKNIGSNNEISTCLNFIKLGWDHHGTMVNGKLLFDAAEL